MSYAASCEDELSVHVDNPCPDREFGRVRSVALIAKDYLATILANPTDPLKWQEGIAAGKITIISKTAGSFDPGDPKELKGYGDNKSSNGPREQTLTYFDPNYKQNYGFYNGITNVTNRVIAFRTYSLVHIADVTANIIAKDPVEDDLESEIVWNVTAKFTSINLPQIHDAAALNEIFGF